MSAAGETTVYTIPYEHKVEEGSAPTLSQVIVGMRVDSHDIWLSQDDDAPIQYQQTDTAETIIPCATGMKGRFASYFATFMADTYARQYLREADVEPLMASPNAFALWMQDGVDLSRFSDEVDPEILGREADTLTDVADKYAYKVVQNGELVESARCQLGQMAVIGFRAYVDHGPTLAQHSVVSLGEARQDCLQVMHIHGRGVLAVSGLEDVQQAHSKDVLYRLGGLPDTALIGGQSGFGQYGLYVAGSATCL